MSKEKKMNDVTDTSANSSNDREYKKKMSRQTIMTISMIFVSILVISMATYAWYVMTNSPKMTNMEFKAGTVGDLWIADSTYLKSGGALDISCSNTWTNELSLSDSAGLDINSGASGTSVAGKGDYGIYQELNPSTTSNGTVFYKPIYSGGNVTSAGELTESTVRNSGYVYEKTFWLKAGAKDNNEAGNKYYNIFLVGQGDDGCLMRTKLSSAAENTSTGAENALRVSFEFESGKTYTPNYGTKSYAANGSSVVRIYEPNANVHNTVAIGSGANLLSAGITPDGVLAAYNAVPYATIKQLFDKSFAVDNSNVYVTGVSSPWGASNVLTYDKAGIAAKSSILCTIRENESVKVIMRVWIEGSDGDCVNGIAAKDIIGRIQFVSEENMAQYGTRNTNESSTFYNDNDPYFAGVANYGA